MSTTIADGFGTPRYDADAPVDGAAIDRAAARRERLRARPVASNFRPGKCDKWPFCNCARS